MYAKEKVAGPVSEYATADKIRRTSPIEESLDMLRSGIGALEESIGMLHSRLEPVLNPAYPPSETSARQESLNVPLADSIQQISVRVYALNTHTRMILDRLGV